MKRTVIILLALSILLLTACSADPKPAPESITAVERNAQTEATDLIVQSESAEPSTQPDTTEPSAQPGPTELVVQTDGAELRIGTPYGVLRYPAAYAEQLKLEPKQEGDAYSLRFLAEIRGVSYPLFTVSMGTGEDGPLFGTITDAGGRTTVYTVEPHELGDLSALDEETHNRIYAMQEALNELCAG